VRRGAPVPGAAGEVFSVVLMSTSSPSSLRVVG